jgi:hypothetical protein
LASTYASRPHENVAFADVFHDEWCAIHQGRACNCFPDVVVRDGSDVITIDEDGNVRKVS